MKVTPPRNFNSSLYRGIQAVEEARRYKDIISFEAKTILFFEILFVAEIQSVEQFTVAKTSQKNFNLSLAKFYVLQLQQ